ncbi:AfsR/SARP family transcriptional regulator [Nocardia nova]|uniref:AfsR/SARP family transcriptional regulator n=1 Tax=Nocardia nova TaxID=37330 RepID=UPI003F53E7E5
MLALLLLHSNKVVRLDAIIDELWGNDPPVSAVRTAQTYIYQLRRHFSQEMPEAVGTLVTHSTGYQLRVAPGHLDLETFTQLLGRGRAAMAADEPEVAAHTLRQALELWSGRALSGVRQGRLIQAHAVHLEEQRCCALELRIQADARLNRHRELVGELKALVLESPLDEWRHTELIKALAHSGRRKEALDAFQNLRSVLLEELGLDPSRQVQELHQDILGGAISCQ